MMAIDCDNDSLRVSSPGDELKNLPALSYMAWVNLDSDSTVAGFITMRNASSGLRKSLGLMWSGGSSFIAMCVYYDGDAALATANAPSLGTWHHICGRWGASENSGRCDVFIDGVNANIASVSPSGSPLTDGGSLVLAAIGDVLFDMDGKLADAAVFDRRLSEDEIRYVAGGCLRATHLDPIFHATLEGTSGTVAVGDIGLRDTTGHGNHVDAIVGTASYYKDPPIHWPIGPEGISFGGRSTRNSRPTMNVATGTSLATLRRTV